MIEWEFTEWLAWLTLGFGVPLSLITTLVLLRKWRRKRYLKVLLRDVKTAAIITVVVLVFGLIFVNNDMIEPWLDVDTTKWITRLAILALAIIPAVTLLLLNRSLHTRNKKGGE